MTIESKPLSIPRNGLVGEWLLDGNALDSNDGTKNNGTATNVTYANTSVGYQKQAGAFNGSSSGITIGGLPASINDNDFSISFSARFNSVSAGRVFYFQDRDSSVELSSGTIRLVLYDGNINNVSYGVSAGVDYHFSFIRNRSTGLSLYVNGELKASSNFTGVASFQAGGTTIGRHKSFNLEYLNGSLQSVRLYNRALSSQEIQTLYLEGKRMIGNYGNPDLFKDCVAYYDFKGDANDVVGGNNGTVNGAALTTDRFGMADSAYSFDGSSYVGIPSSSALQLVSNYTIMAFVQAGTNPGTDTCIVGKDSNTGERAYYLASNASPVGGSNKFSFYINGASGGYVNSTTTITQGNDYVVCGTHAGSQLKIYVNGNYEAAGSATATPTGNSELQIGARQYSGARQFYNGKIYKVLIFNSAKTDDEVRAISKILMESPSFYPFTKRLTGSLTQGLRAYIDGSVSGTTAYDQSGNGNNGTLDASQTVRRRFQSKALVFTATDKISFPNTNGIRAVSAWIYPTANDKTIVTLSSGKTVSVNSSNVITSTLTNPTYYVNGKVGVSVSLNKWSHIIVTFDSENSSSGSFGSDSFVGEMGDMGILTSPVNLEQAQNLFYPTYLQ